LEVGIMEVVWVLVEYGVDPNAQDPNNMTALELARGSGI